MTIKNLTEESSFTKEQLIEHITRQLDQFHRLIKAQPLGDNTYNQKTIAAMEIALAALTHERQLNTANLISKFYERYPLVTFSFDTERAEALGYFMAGAEIQCFGKFIEYEGGE